MPLNRWVASLLVSIVLFKPTGNCTAPWPVSIVMSSGVPSLLSIIQYISMYTCGFTGIPCWYAFLFYDGLCWVVLDRPLPQGEGPHDLINSENKTADVHAHALTLCKCHPLLLLSIYNQFSGWGWQFVCCHPPFWKRGYGMSLLPLELLNPTSDLDFLK